MKKKLAALFLAAVMMLGLAACGNGASSQSAQTPAGPSAASDAQSARADNTAGGKVVMYYPLGAIPSDQDKVSQAMHDYVEEKLGLDLEVQVVPNSSYEDQLNLIMAGSEQIDLCLVFGRNVSSYVARGGLVDLNELLDTYGPDIQACLGDYLNAGSVGGVRYQVPVNRSLFYQYGIVMRKDLLDKYEIDPADIQSEEDLDAVFAAIKAGEPDMAMVQPESTTMFTYVDYDSLSDDFGVLMNYGQNLDVVNLYETDEFREQCEQHREWFEKGYIASDVLTNTESSADLVRAGKLFSFTCTVGPGTNQDKSNQCGRDMVYVALRKPFSYTGKVSTYGWGILNNSKNPEGAMQVLYLMYSDPAFLNLIDWGIEGVHYQLKEGSSRIITFADGVDDTSSGYFHNWSFAFGDQLNAYFWDGTEEDFPEQVRAMNESAIQSKAMGFAYDMSEVKNEVTAVSNVVDQYAKALTLGCVDPEKTLPEFQQALRDAGIENIIAAKQQQLNTWAEASGVS